MSIKKGSQVSVHYTLTVNGKVLDTSKGRAPLSYIQGEGRILQGFEEAMLGLNKGDKKTFDVSPQKGYGVHNPEAIHNVPKAAFQDPSRLKVGDIVTGEISGQQFQARVIELKEDDVVLDMNHPLAGKTLHFEVEVVDVK